MQFLLTPFELGDVRGDCIGAAVGRPSLLDDEPDTVGQLADDRRLEISMLYHALAHVRFHAALRLGNGPSFGMGPD